MKQHHVIAISKLWKFAKLNGYMTGFGISPFSAASDALESLGYQWHTGQSEKAFCNSNKDVIVSAVSKINVVTEKQQKPSTISPKLTVKPVAQPPHLAYAMTDDFLSSYEWRRVRMIALTKYGPVCQCCGATPATGAVMNVDHIKPRKIFPELALTVDNLQILCHECNHGKGNWDMTDWRQIKETCRIYAGL